MSPSRHWSAAPSARPPARPRRSCRCASTCAAWSPASGTAPTPSAARWPRGSWRPAAMPCPVRWPPRSSTWPATRPGCCRPAPRWCRWPTRPRTWPAGEQDPAASWHTENALIPGSDATLGRVRLDAKALTSRVVASRELLEDAPGIENELRNAFARQFALTVDYAALYGAGVDREPRGVKNTAGITTINYGGANGTQPISYDGVIDAIGALEDVNETPSGIIWSPRTGRTFASLTDTTGQPIRMPDVVAGLPRYSTAQVPNNLTLGTSTNTSDVFVADWSKLLVGVRTGLQIQVLTERYADNGQFGFLAWWRGDIAVARPKAYTVLKGVRP